MKVQTKDRRVQKFLDRHLQSPAFCWDDVTDPRARRGRRWSLGELLNASMAGMLAGCETLRDVEALTEEMGAMGRKYVSRRLPDTTAWDLLPRLVAAEFRTQLRKQVRMFWRSKMLEPQDLPCGVVSFDGKGLGALEHDAEGDAQKGHRQDGSPYWLARVLRAALTSAQAKVLLDQVAIGARTNEMGSFATFFDEVVDAYDALFEIVTTDAGMTSKANADRVCAKQKSYVMACKGTQPELLAEAHRLLLPRVGQTPDAQSDWEVYQGKRVQRRLFRTSDIAGYHGWDHLRQAWLVEQHTQHPSGVIVVEQRFFLSSVRPGRLSAKQILAVVRGHWGIENDCFWSLDMQWNEDALPWCTTGKAVEVISLIRVMAYNLLQLARKRNLRRRLPNGEHTEPPPWRRLFEWVKQALRLDLTPAPLAVSG